MSTTDRATLLAAFDEALQPALFKDYGPNGLPVEGRERIGTLVSGVTRRPSPPGPMPSSCTTACSGAGRTGASRAG